MNAGGVDKACKSSGTYFEEVEIISKQRMDKFSGERVSNTLVTYPEDGNSSSKGEVMSDGLARVNLARGFGSGLGPIS